MLRDNSFPDEKTRRWVLAKLLQIPPVLLGVSSLADLLPQAHHEQSLPIPTPSQAPPFELKAYRQVLRRYMTNYTKTDREAEGTIDQRVANMEQEILYGTWSHLQRLQIVQLLCQYHLMAAGIAWDQQWYDAAVLRLNRAYQFAQNYELADTQAAILFKRGSVFEAWGASYKDKLDFAPAQRYLAWARNDFLAAQSLEKYLYPGLQGHIQLYLGVISSHLATHPSQLHQAIVEIGKAERFVGKDTAREDIYFVRLDEERYQLSVASAYTHAPTVIACYPKDARRALRNAWATRPTLTAQANREAFETILLAKSYFLEKEYERATEQAYEALAQAAAVHSKENVARVAALCDKLVLTDYGKKSVLVAELDVAITMAQRPELFQ